ncbi:MAG: hypothetical protein V4479_15785 [Actinomycetota bacterium]
MPAQPPFAYRALRTVLLWPPIARPGYWFATGVAYVWGAILSRHLPKLTNGVYLASGCPAWAFGRGGTTVGAVYLTRDNDAQPVLEHESVHRQQWKHYGLAFIPLYVRAGSAAQNNRFEIAAGLAKGGYA